MDALLDGGGTGIAVDEWRQLVQQYIAGQHGIDVGKAEPHGRRQYTAVANLAERRDERPQFSAKVADALLMPDMVEAARLR